MTYQRFEGLPVWQAAMQLTRRQDRYQRRADAFWRKIEMDHRQRTEAKPDLKPGERQGV